MNTGVLNGLKVLDLGIITAGASTSAMLADLGADVVKVEGPAYIDPFRQWGGATGAATWWNESPQFIATNRNKKGVCIDLKSASGKALFLALAAKCDIIVENFRVGVMESLGLGFDVLSQANDRIILASISGQGATGPLARNVSFGSTLEASSGMSSLMRYEDGPPHITGRTLNFPDQVVSLFAASVILAAVVSRAKATGPIHLDISQRELTAFMIGEIFSEGWDGVADTCPVGPAARAQGIFRTADGTYIAASLTESAASADFDGLFPESISFSDWIGSQPADTAVARLRTLGVAAEIAATVAAGPGPHPLRAANAFATDGRGTQVKGFPIRLGGKDIPVAAPAPNLGEHNEQVLRQWLSISDEDYRTLVEAGTIATAPR